MEDNQIVQLYWNRDEAAIEESNRKFGAYCGSIANRILENFSDAEECVNDTWMHAWNAMPPHRPDILSVFLGKITRNLAFDRYRKAHRKKRGNGLMEITLDELAECLPGSERPEKQWEEKEKIREINRFLRSLSEEKRAMFILRYWYVKPISEIARQLNTTENYVSVTLSRLRGRLKNYLTEKD